MINQKFMLVPYWYENVLSRNDLTLVDILDYSKIRNIMSIMDIAQLAFINGESLSGGDAIKSLKIGKVLGLRQAFCSWQQSAQEEQRTELVSVLPELLCSADLEESIVRGLSRQTDVDAPSAVDDNQTYKIVDLHDVIAVVLYQGFIDTVNSDIQSYVGLLMDLIEKLYALNPVHEVNQTLLFKELLCCLDDNRVKQINTTPAA